MDWIQTVSIIVAMGTFIYWMVQRLERDIDRIGEEMKEQKFEMKEQRNELKGWMKHSIAMASEQSKRTDALYEICMRMLEERK